MGPLVVVLQLALLNIAPPPAANAARQFEVRLPGSVIQVTYSGGEGTVTQQQLQTWVQDSAHAVSDYLGGFPLSRVSITIRAIKGRGIRGGRALVREEGASILVAVGENTSAVQFRKDWILVHEMLHMGFPSLDDRHHWAEEGFATYAEPIARLRAGLITREEMWGELVRGLPNGLPAAGDAGLDHTHTWGRTYWGGALFYFLADIEIHKRSGNKKGLEHAFRGVLSQGGDITKGWEISRVYRAGDAATGGKILEDLYKKMRATPVAVDLPPVWAQLGIIERDGKIIFNDDAPLSFIRRAIETGEPLHRTGQWPTRAGD